MTGRIFMLVLLLGCLGNSGFAQAVMPFELKAYLQESGRTEQSVHLFLKGDGAQIKSWLDARGGVFRYTAGNTHVVWVSPGLIPELLAQHFVRSAGFRLHEGVALNDTMRVRNNIDSVHAGYAALHRAYTGKGVVVGIIDTGVDFLHPDFLDSAGNTRVLAVWDQSLPSDPQLTPALYGYGQAWDSTAIRNGQCTQADYAAHGTTVAGCAAGNGNATGTHKGVAPDASLVVVKTHFGLPNWTATVADAVDYIYRIADSLGMPCVINASVGTYLGSHDGRDPAARYIDSLIREKPGRLMVCAAGNSGNWGNYHLSYPVTSDTSFTWFSYLPAGQGVLPYDAVFFEAWADTAAFNQVHIAVGADSDSPYSFRGRTEFYRVADFLNTIHTDTIRNNGNILAIVDFYAELQDDLYLLQVHLKEPDSSQYRFRFMTTGQGTFDIWSTPTLGYSAMFSAGLPSVAQFPDMVNYRTPDSSKILVSSFTCLESVITVGNYHNYVSYTDYAGNVQTLPGTTGQISINSSRGPTRDNRLKPEISASGDLTMSAGPLASLAYMQVNEPWKLSPDGMHMRNGGTSMASPVVAGIGALLLEKCPQSTWADFRQHLIASAKKDVFTGPDPSISYGYGKTDAFRMLLETHYTPLITGEVSICEGAQTTLAVSGSYSSYLWNTGDTTSSIVTALAGIYTVETVNQAGCTSEVAEVSVQVHPLPARPAIDGSAAPVLSTPAVAAAYQWFADNQPISGAQQHTYTVTSAAYYQVSITDTNTCSNISDSLWVNVSAIGEQEGSGGALLFPNPSSGVFYLQLPGEQSGVLQVYNLQGQLVATRHFTRSALIDWDPGLESGTYLLKVNTGEAAYVLRLVR